MLRRMRIYRGLALAALLPRASIVKVKINGRCVNRCTFCLFHDDPHKLEVEDLARFFGMMERPRFRRLDINGGEPTIHPRFPAIAAYLRASLGDGAVLHLGTNLIPLARDSQRSRRLLQAALDGFDMFSVGCDDEHRNVECLERLAGEIVGSGRLLCVNVMEDYCSPETRRRILAVRDRVGLRLSFSSVHHFYADRARVNDLFAPCRHRARELLVNCNGDAFYCFHQELEQPLFNLHTVSRLELDYYLEQHVPEPYRFCGSCPCYRPQLTHGLRAALRLGRLAQPGGMGAGRGA